MKRILFTALILLPAGFLFAQAEIGGADAASMEDGLPQQSLTELSLDKFEMEGFWHSTISSDSGFTVSRLFDGGAGGKTPIEGEPDDLAADSHVLGVRVDFLRRGYSSIYIQAARPIPIEGITKTVSIQVAGRNYNHRLNLVIQDFYGRYFEVYLGKLNFQGWKKLVAAIPPQQEAGSNGIIQQNYHYSNISGIKIVGFRIDCDPVESFGTYYVYLDDLRAVSDLFTEQSRDPDDPQDDW